MLKTLTGMVIILIINNQILLQINRFILPAVLQTTNHKSKLSESIPPTSNEENSRDRSHVSLLEFSESEKYEATRRDVRSNINLL